MINAIKFLDCFILLVVIILKTGIVHALSCESGTEPVLKIEYDAEDHMNCKDPKSLKLPLSTPWGVNESITYQAQGKEKREDRGQCVVSDGTENGMIIYKNKKHHHMWIYTANKSFDIDVAGRNGSVQYHKTNPVNETDSYTHTKKELKKFEKMQVLPSFNCTIIPPFEFDPIKTTNCVTEIDNMRVVLYWEYTDIVSKHVNWYKAISVERICAKQDIFNPPDDIVYK